MSQSDDEFLAELKQINAELAAYAQVIKATTENLAVLRARLMDQALLIKKRGENASIPD
jgi:hypothetical protein